MAIKKSDLYSSLWASCDELRGGMDASQYKDYVLFMLFIKYISDKYANSDDLEPSVVIPKGASFQDMVALKGKSDIGNMINTQIIQPLIDANSRLARSDFPDFNDPNKLGQGKEMVDRLTNLVAIFQKPELNFADNRAEHDDILGDAYEYLMRHFATESGKSKGQFYTPSEVSRVIAKVVGIGPHNTKASTTAYDPTCGSGSLLLKVAAEAGKHITLEGQEKDVTTAGLARMNMILHDFPTASILSGNTLAIPKFLDGPQLRTYDYVVANPPFSDKAWSTGLLLGENGKSDAFQRFSWGLPPTKQGDYAYLLHIVRSMKASGKAACILPHGVLFRGNAEAIIRKQLVSSGILKGIIGLPANLFYGTGIPACILVLDKENASARKGVMMIDASKGFLKDGNKNRLREQDIHRIVDAFRKGEDVPGYARLVPLAEMASEKNDFNLNLPRYIDSTEPEDIQDLAAHLQGGIPHRDLDALDAYWQVMPSLRATLFSPLPLGEGPGVRARPGYSQLQQPIAEVKATILGHTEFTAFLNSATAIFDDWRARHTPRLTAFAKGDHPKELAEALAEDLLASFKAAPLVDEYAVYQQLMDYWAEAMQDDAYLIALDGWVAKPQRVVETDKKGKQKDKGWACDLLPKPYVVARYFAAEQAALEAKQAGLDAVNSQLTELEEEHSGDDAVFASFDKVNAASVKERVKEIGADPDSADELTVLKQWLKLSAEEAALKKAVRDLDALLDQQAFDQYARLSVVEIQAMVIHDKWLARLGQDLQSELDRVNHALTWRIRELAERYATPLSHLVNEKSDRVGMHLQRMGVPMQQLLTGQARLPGFHRKWETKRLDQVGDCLRGVTYRGDADLFPHDSSRTKRLLRSNNVQDAMVVASDVQFVNAARVSEEQVLRTGDVLICMANGSKSLVGKAGFFDLADGFEYTFGAFMGVFRCADIVDRRFVFYLFQTSRYRAYINNLLAGSSINNLSPASVLSLEFSFPEKDEQTAIATVLSDMDAELSALEARLTKTRAIKQGMMQELLTGRTRLI